MLGLRTPNGRPDALTEALERFAGQVPTGQRSEVGTALGEAKEAVRTALGKYLAEESDLGLKQEAIDAILRVAERAIDDTTETWPEADDEIGLALQGFIDHDLAPVPGASYTMTPAQFEAARADNAANAHRCNAPRRDGSPPKRKGKR